MAEKTIYFGMFSMCRLVTSYYDISYEKIPYMVFKMVEQMLKFSNFKTNVISLQYAIKYTEIKTFISPHLS